MDLDIFFTSLIAVFSFGVLAMNIYQISLESTIETGTLVKLSHRFMAIASICYAFSKIFPISLRNNAGDILSSVLVDVVTICISTTFIFACYELKKAAEVSLKFALSADDESTLQRHKYFHIVVPYLSLIVSWIFQFIYDSTDFEIIFVGTVALILFLALIFLWISFYKLYASFQESSGYQSGNNPLLFFRNYLVIASILIPALIVYMSLVIDGKASKPVSEKLIKSHAYFEFYGYADIFYLVSISTLTLFGFRRPTSETDISKRQTITSPSRGPSRSVISRASKLSVRYLDDSTASSRNDLREVETNSFANHNPIESSVSVISNLNESVFDSQAEMVEVICNLKESVFDSQEDLVEIEVSTDSNVKS